MSGIGKVLSHRGEEDFDSYANLIALLEELERGLGPSRPEAVEVTRTNGDALVILLGNERSFALFQQASGEPPYLASSAEATETGLLTYYYLGEHHSEISDRHLVDRNVVKEVLRDFVEHESGVPETIEWTET